MFELNVGLGLLNISSKAYSDTLVGLGTGLGVGRWIARLHPKIMTTSDDAPVGLGQNGAYGQATLTKSQFGLVQRQAQQHLCIHKFVFPNTLR